MYAVSGNPNVEIAEYLIHLGADVNARDVYGWTPLMIAARDTVNPEIIALLLDAGADGRIKSNDNHTAFDYANDNPYVRESDVYWRLNQARWLYTPPQR
jgi:ankyrin repeat protein